MRSKPSLNIPSDGYIELSFKLRRIDKPTHVHSDGDWFWVDDDDLEHREDGPATSVRGKFTFFWHGGVVTKEKLEELRLKSKAVNP